MLTINRINKKIKTVWGISEIGFSVMSTMDTSFLVFFLTDVAQLPLAITAFITGFTALADAISAVIAGSDLQPVFHVRNLQRVENRRKRQRRSYVLLLSGY